MPYSAASGVPAGKDPSAESKLEDQVHKLGVQMKDLGQGFQRMQTAMTRMAHAAEGVSELFSRLVYMVGLFAGLKRSYTHGPGAMLLFSGYDGPGGGRGGHGGGGGGSKGSSGKFKKKTIEEQVRDSYQYNVGKRLMDMQMAGLTEPGQVEARVAALMGEYDATKQTYDRNQILERYKTPASGAARSRQPVVPGGFLPDVPYVAFDYETTRNGDPQDPDFFANNLIRSVSAQVVRYKKGESGQYEASYEKPFYEKSLGNSPTSEAELGLLLGFIQAMKQAGLHQAGFAGMNTQDFDVAMSKYALGVRHKEALGKDYPGRDFAAEFDDGGRMPHFDMLQVLANSSLGGKLKDQGLKDFKLETLFAFIQGKISPTADASTFLQTHETDPALAKAKTGTSGLTDLEYMQTVMSWVVRALQSFSAAMKELGVTVADTEEKLTDAQKAELARSKEIETLAADQKADLAETEPQKKSRKKRGGTGTAQMEFLGAAGLAGGMALGAASSPVLASAMGTAAVATGGAAAAMGIGGLIYHFRAPLLEFAKKVGGFAAKLGEKASISSRTAFAAKHGMSLEDYDKLGPLARGRMRSDSMGRAAAGTFITAAAIGGNTLQAGAPDAFATLKGSIGLAVAQLSGALIPATVQLSAWFQDLGDEIASMSQGLKDAIGGTLKWTLLISGGIIVFTKLVSGLYAFGVALKMLAAAAYTTATTLKGWSVAAASSMGSFGAPVLAASIVAGIWSLTRGATKEEIKGEHEKGKEEQEKRRAFLSRHDPDQTLLNRSWRFEQETSDLAKKMNITREEAGKIYIQADARDLRRELFGRKGENAFAGRFRSASDAAGAMGQVPDFFELSKEEFGRLETHIKTLLGSSSIPDKAQTQLDQLKATPRQLSRNINGGPVTETYGIPGKNLQGLADYLEEEEMRRGRLLWQKSRVLEMISANEKGIAVTPRDLSTLPSPEEKNEKRRRSLLYELSSSTKATPQYSSIEEVYKKIQLQALSLDPLGMAQQKIHLDNQVKMLTELTKLEEARIDKDKALIEHLKAREKEMRIEFGAGK